MQTRNNEAEFNKLQSGTGTWSSLDIFLFTNGQKYSPPRKYNLRASELDWWDATLNYLARLQYGSMYDEYSCIVIIRLRCKSTIDIKYLPIFPTNAYLKAICFISVYIKKLHILPTSESLMLNPLDRPSRHTGIELYSIDGKKIGGPMELRNGSAYVAVEPPDAFVQSGYEKYLIKATRSWEKRQESRTSESALSKPVSDKVNVGNEIIRLADTNDSTNIQIIQDIRIQPGTATQDQTVITVKSDSVNKAKANGVASTIKQVPKRKSSVSQQRPSILRKSYVNPVAPLARKGSRNSRVSKEDPAKNKLESSARLSEDVPLKNGSLLITKITESTLESPNKVNSKTTVMQTTDQNEVLDKSLPYTSTAPLTIPPLNNTLENKPADIDLQKNEIVEKDILSVSFPSEENFQSICINADNCVKENPPILLNDSTPVVINSTTPKAMRHHSNFDPNQCALPSSTNSTNDRVAQKNYVVSDSQTAESIIISISPGDTVKLKLSIAIQNSSTDTLKNELGPQSKPPSAPLATKSELKSPGRCMLEVRTPSTGTYGGETPTMLTKSWQTTFTNENIEEELNNVKLAVCRCNCCLNSDKVLPAGATPVYLDNNNYFILLPSAKNSDNINSCNCRQENFTNICDGDERHLILPKVASSAVDSVSVHENKLPISKTHLKTSECECPIPEPSIAKNQTSTFEHTSSQLSTFEASKCCTCDDTYRNASDSMFRVPSTNNPKTVTDNSTQTNWNNILLEARLHKDGHYTFHMPRLDQIKY